MCPCRKIDEVIVVGYGTQQKANLSGAVAQLDSKELTSRPISNVSSGLQGMMPGVTVTSGQGRPGQDGSTIRIRGVGTLNSASPYILIYGIESGSMNDILTDILIRTGMMRLIGQVCCISTMLVLQEVRRT